MEVNYGYQKKDIIARHINHLVDDAKDILKAGNKDGAAYLACIAGMWWNHCKLNLLNPFSDSFLNSWFTTGYDCYTQSIGMTVALRKKMLDYESDWAKKHPEGATKLKPYPSQRQEPTTPPPEKKSIWDIKLW